MNHDLLTSPPTKPGEIRPPLARPTERDFRCVYLGLDHYRRAHDPRRTDNADQLMERLKPLMSPQSCQNKKKKKQKKKKKKHRRVESARPLGAQGNYK